MYTVELEPTTKQLPTTTSTTNSKWRIKRAITLCRRRRLVSLEKKRERKMAKRNGDLMECINEVNYTIGSSMYSVSCPLLRGPQQYTELVIDKCAILTKAFVLKLNSNNLRHNCEGAKLPAKVFFTNFHVRRVIFSLFRVVCVRSVETRFAFVGRRRLKVGNRQIREENRVYAVWLALRLTFMSRE